MGKANHKGNKTQLRTFVVQIGVGLMALEGNRVESRG